MTFNFSRTDLRNKHCKCCEEEIEFSAPTYMSGQSRGTSRVTKLPLLPHNVAGRCGPSEENLPDPRDDPQAVAKTLGLLKHKGLYRLILVLLSRIFSLFFKSFYI